MEGVGLSVASTNPPVPETSAYHSNILPVSLLIKIKKLVLQKLYGVLIECVSLNFKLRGILGVTL